jgi:hypothetical protein
MVTAIKGNDTSTFGGQVVIPSPAFSAVSASDQAISAGTNTKINFGTEEFDTNSNFSSSRFTPTAEGYYSLNTVIRFSAASAYQNIMIWKNGSYTGYIAGHRYSSSGAGQNIISGSYLIYMNGTTDYVEIYCYDSAGSTIQFNANSTRFSGHLVRAV